MAIRTDLQNKANVIGSTMTPKVGPSNQYGEVKKLMDGLKQVPSGPAAGDRAVAAQQPRAKIDLLANKTGTFVATKTGTVYFAIRSGGNDMKSGISIKNVEFRGVN